MTDNIDYDRIFTTLPVKITDNEKVQCNHCPANNLYGIIIAQKKPIKTYAKAHLKPKNIIVVVVTQ